MRKVTGFFIACALTLFIPLSASAEDGTVPYSVEAVIPDNQINENATYFDIEMDQDQRQNLEVIIHNTSNETITVNVTNHFTTTNSNGIITYDGMTEEPHESMQHPFDEISSISQEEVEVGANSREEVILNVQAPDEPFDGVILGGLYFTLEADTPEEDSGLEIQNQYSYALAVQITESGNNTEIKPELLLENLNPGIVNHRTGLQTEFVNPTPVIISELEFNGTVSEAGSEEVIYERKADNFTIAPNSQFNFPVMFDNERLEPGTYTFRADVGNGEYNWQFEEDFEITEDTADEANESAVELEEDDSWMVYVILAMAAVILLLAIVIIYLFLKRKK